MIIEITEAITDKLDSALSNLGKMEETGFCFRKIECSDIDTVREICQNSKIIDIRDEEWNNNLSAFCMHKFCSINNGDVVHYHEEDKKNIQQNLVEMVSKLKKKKDTLILHYQPIFRCVGDYRDCIYKECLLRMYDNNKYVSAGPHIDAAEKLQDTLWIDKMVLDLAIKDLYRDMNQVFGINISMNSAQDEVFLDYVISRIYGFGDRLIFEITEYNPIVRPAQIRKFMSKVRSLGCRVACDDYGSGFTLESYLDDFDWDFVKIDGSYIKNIESQRSKVFMKRITSRYDSSKMIAEMVQCDADIGFLSNEYDIECFQGFCLEAPNC